MIIDDLANAHLYHGLGGRLERALRWLAQADLAGMAPGRYPIEGDDLFAMVQAYRSKPRAEGFWEAHQRYADV